MDRWLAASTGILLYFLVRWGIIAKWRAWLLTKGITFNRRGATYRRKKNR
jgi:hypothetical protein